MAMLLLIVFHFAAIVASLPLPTLVEDSTIGRGTVTISVSYDSLLNDRGPAVDVVDYQLNGGGSTFNQRKRGVAADIYIASGSALNSDYEAGSEFAAASDGFPNGRRPADDVANIELKGFGSVRERIKRYVDSITGPGGALNNDYKYTIGVEGLGVGVTDFDVTVAADTRAEDGALKGVGTVLEQNKRGIGQSDGSGGNLLTDLITEAGVSAYHGGGIVITISSGEEGGADKRAEDGTLQEDGT